jgi:hypothetical protein
MSRRVASSSRGRRATALLIAFVLLLVGCSPQHHSDLSLTDAGRLALRLVGSGSVVWILARSADHYPQPQAGGEAFFVAVVDSNDVMRFTSLTKDGTVLPGRGLPYGRPSTRRTNHELRTASRLDFASVIKAANQISPRLDEVRLLVTYLESGETDVTWYVRKSHPYGGPLDFGIDPANGGVKPLPPS